MAKTITIAALLLAMFLTIECRQGWRTYGNGYFVYESKTDFQKTNELRIDGIFSVMTNATAKSTLLSVYDANDKFAFQLMVYKDIFYTAYNIGGIIEEQAWNAHGISSGYGYAFTATVTKNQSAFHHTLKTDILSLSRTGFTIVIPKVTFNFTRVTIKIGGNSLPDPVASMFFEGCLSNFTFQGTDIISTYFKQYPSNTNPVRGKETFIKRGHGFSNVSASCDDVMTTTGPTETTGPSTTEHPSSTIQSNTNQSDVTTQIGVYSTSTTPTPSSGRMNQMIIGILFFTIWFSYIVL